NRSCLLLSSSSFEFLRYLWIAEIIFVEVKHLHARPMLHFAFAEIMQERPPMFVSFEIFGYVSGEKNMPCVAAIHNPLCHVDSSSSDIRPVIDVRGLMDWPAVNSHAHPDTRIVL